MWSTTGRCATEHAPVGWHAAATGQHAGAAGWRAGAAYSHCPGDELPGVRRTRDTQGSFLRQLRRSSAPYGPGAATGACASGPITSCTSPGSAGHRSAGLL